MREVDGTGSSTTAEATASLAVTLAWAAAAALVAFVLATFLSVLVRRIGRRSAVARELSLRMRRPTRALLMVVGVWIAFARSAHASEPWFDAVQHALLIATIVTVAWTVGAAAFVVEERALARYTVHDADDRRARRARTQITVVRRITVAVIVICTVAAVLLTFPAARTAGASLLASAGVLSIVAGLAAQSSLANAFAGMQIAFTDAIRVDDVVVLEGQFGRIEEITLTYVVVHVWDDRRIILPCTYFTATPFENWTRRAADLLGTVEIDVDFGVPLDGLRGELDRLLDESSLWDRRTGVLQVTDAVGGVVRLRALVSAPDAPTLWDLRCYVREGLVEWLQREAPAALPRTRFESLPGAGEEESAAEQRADAATPAADGETGKADADVAEREEPMAPKVPTAPAVVPARPPVRQRALPTPMRSTVRPVAPSDPTVVLGSLRSAASPDETVLVPAVEAEAVSRSAGPERSALFSGSAEAEARSKRFHGPGQDVIDEREQTAERNLGRTGEIEAVDERRKGVAPDSGEGGRTHGDGDGT
jgi:small-conductance mechanosensitive channel